MNSTVPPCGDSNDASSAANESRLLSLPSPVIDVILKKCNVKSLLTLREVCKTTKAWVDNAPELKAEDLMSKVQVRMGINHETVQRFNETAPPLPITSLFLDTSRMPQVDNPEDYEEMWDKYFDYWTPRLISLQIQKQDPSEIIIPFNDSLRIRRTVRRFLDECPRLQKVVFLRDFDWELAMPFPQSFLNLTHLFVDKNSFLTSIREHDEMIDKFFTHLQNNKNLKELKVKVLNTSHMETFKKFIECHKKNPQLRMSIKTGRCFSFGDEEGFIPTSDVHFIDLVRTAAVAECQVAFHLRMSIDANRVFRRLFTTAKQELNAVEYFKFINEQLRSLSVLKPLEDLSIIDLRTIGGLKNLSVERMFPQDLANFQFPPNLSSLRCGAGFPTVGYLPLTITSLLLCNLRCGLDELERSWALLSNHCVNLEQFGMSYTCTEKSVVSSSNEIGGSGDHQATIIRFQKLESLSLKVYINAEDEHIPREAILNRLKLDQLPLRHLVLSTHYTSVAELDVVDNELRCPGAIFFNQQLMRQFNGGEDDAHDVRAQQEFEHNFLPLLDEQILSRMCEGPIASTLMFMDYNNLSVPQTAKAVMIKLQGICEANIQNRIAEEGRGPWLYKYPEYNCFYWAG